MLQEDVAGVSERTVAFGPGLEVDGKTVCRTFQPSFVQRSDGTILAFCQGRLEGGADDDPKVVLMARSDDGGRNWSEARPISGPMSHYAMSAYRSNRDGHECFSVLTLVCLRGTEQLYDRDYGMMKNRTGINIDAVGRDTPMALCRFDSHDGGCSWEMETLTGDRTPLMHDYDDGTLIFMNPIGQVHVIPEGIYEGRYIMGGPVSVVPRDEEMTDYFRNHPTSGSGTMYSDDQGETWHMDGMITDYLGNEASAVSVENGQTLLIIRRLNRQGKYDDHAPETDFRPDRGMRMAHTSSDCGRTWSEPFALGISDVRCHGTLSRAGNRLLFSIPEGENVPPEEKTFAGERTRGRIYFSEDEGKTWDSKLLDEGTFSYSTVDTLTGERHMALFSRGSMGEDGVGCRVFTNEWLDRD